MTQDAPLPLDQSATAARSRIRLHHEPETTAKALFERARRLDQVAGFGYEMGDFLTDLVPFLDALSRRVPASGGEAERADELWESLLPYMQVASHASGAHNAYDDKVKALDLIRAALSPIVAAPEGWRQSLARLAHDLREHSNAIREGIEKHGSYNVPWNVLSWGKDMTALGAEKIESIIGDTCRACDGAGIVRNPEARYEMDRDTGFMETNDPEEIDCPACGGSGLAQVPREPTVTEDEEMPF